MDLNEENLTPTIKPINKKLILQKVTVNEYATEVEQEQHTENCDFETAITAAGYGTFSWLLRSLYFFECSSNLYRNTALSFVLSPLGCEFNLSNGQLGFLNGVAYGGNIIFSLIWGILTDTLGRMRLLAVCAALEAFCALLVAFSTSYEMLLVAKLFSGIVSAGINPMYTTYIAEAHSSKYRSTVMVWTGVFRGLANITLPLLAWAVIPQQWSFYIGNIFFPSWRIFLLFCIIPSALSSIVFTFLPESPRFLMSVGKNKEALSVFKTIYAINTGKPKSTYPVKSLVNEISSSAVFEQQSKIGMHKIRHAVVQGVHQFKPLFHGRLLYYGILVITFHFANFMSNNTIRLWSPKYLSTLMEWEDTLSNATTLCDFIELPVANATDISVDCSATTPKGYVFASIAIVGVTSSIFSLVFSFLLKYMDTKWAAMICTHLEGITFGCMYYATSSATLLASLAISQSSNTVGILALTSKLVDIFPTSVRATAVNLALLFGRTGSMSGNFGFPVLLEWQCFFPFIGVAIILNVTALLIWALPDTKGKALQ